jgi:hypothetical protein
MRDAFVALQPDYVTLGQILNLSVGGLAFRCLGDEKPSSGSFELDIFWPDRAFYLYRIPFVIIWGFKTANDATLNSSTMWQGGVQFGELKPYQEFQLARFIENCTKSEV